LLIYFLFFYGGIKFLGGRKLKKDFEKSRKLQVGKAKTKIKIFYR
jgi:hypothetical protein